MSVEEETVNTGTDSAEAREATETVEDEPPPPQPPVRLRGFVKSYCPFKKRGSVRVQGNKRDNVVAREFFIDPDEADKCDELSVGAAISFLLKANRHGQPRACNIQTMIKGIPQRAFVKKLADQEEPVDWETTYTGRIVWHLIESKDALPASLGRKDAGYGWIACDETKKMFGYDVWAYPSQLAGCKVGDWVNFKVSIDYYWSWPVARDIRPAVAPNLDPLLVTQTSRAVGDSLANTIRGNPNLAQTLDDVIACMEAQSGSKIKSVAESDNATRTNVVATSPTADVAATEAASGARADSSATAQPPSKDWQRYALEDGQGYWWYRESNGDYFLESDPGAWTKYADPSTGGHYWWKDEEHFFFV